MRSVSEGDALMGPEEEGHTEGALVRSAREGETVGMIIGINDGLSVVTISADEGRMVGDTG